MATYDQLGRGHWRVRISMPGGRRRARCIRGSKDDAIALGKKMERDRERGTLRVRSAETVGDLVRDWLREHYDAEEIGLATLQDYLDLVERAKLRSPWLLERSVTDVTRGDIRRWYADLRRAGSPRTADRIGTILVQAFEAAVADETIDRNPAREVRRVGKKRRERERRPVKVLSAEETARLLRALDFGETTDLVIALLAQTGLRPSEAIGLRLIDVDLDARELHVRQRIRRLHKAGLDVAPPKSKAGRRPLVIPASLIPALRAEAKRAAEAALAAGKGKREALLFSTENATPLDLRNLRARALAPAIKRAKVPPITLYSLRHGVGTRLIAEGMSIPDTAAVLGHADGKLVIDTYAHAQPDAAKRAEEILERAHQA